MNHDEKARLERISNVSLYAAGVNPETIKYSFKIAERYLVGDSLLEVDRGDFFKIDGPHTLFAELDR